MRRVGLTFLIVYNIVSTEVYSLISSYLLIKIYAKQYYIDIYIYTYNMYHKKYRQEGLTQNGQNVLLSFAANIVKFEKSLPTFYVYLVELQNS